MHIAARRLTCSDMNWQGFKNVKNMGGGYLDWVKNEFPVKALRVNEDL